MRDDLSTLYLTLMHTGDTNSVSTFLWCPTGLCDGTSPRHPLTEPPSDLIQCRSIESRYFADGTQLQDSMPPQNSHFSISSLETCFSDLKLNKDKTDALLVSSYCL